MTKQVQAKNWAGLLHVWSDGSVRSWPEPEYPAWVPAPGTFANVSLNVPQDVHPCPTADCVYIGSSALNAAFNAWTGGTFAPELGALGSYLCWGGGHLAGYANNVFRYDVATQLWSSMKTPSAYAGSANIDSNGAFPDGTPAPPHTYHTFGILSSADGGGDNGSMIAATQPAVMDNADSRDTRWWRFDLETATWSVFIDSSGIAGGTLSQKCMVQEPNGNMWWFGAGYLPNIRRVTPAGSITSYGVDVNSNGDAVGGVAGATRMLVLHGLGDGVPTRIFDLAAIEGGATGASAHKPTAASGTAGPVAGSLEWVPEVGGFANIEWSSPATIRWLKPSNPADPWGSTWAWSAETFTGAGGATAQACSNGAFGRLKWVDAVKCLLWAPNVDDPMQVYRPAGT